MNNYYSYQESLDIVEKFMVDSRIREYCETVCKGMCCKECYNSPNACFKNEGRRLPCSVYVCPGLTSRLPDEIKHKLVIAGQGIDKVLKPLMKNGNCFYDVNSLKIQTDFKVNKSKIDVLADVKGIGLVKDKVKSLIDDRLEVGRLNSEVWELYG